MNKKKWIKRGLTLLLSLVLIMGMLPMGVFASDMTTSTESIATTTSPAPEDLTVNAAGDEAPTTMPAPEVTPVTTGIPTPILTVSPAVTPTEPTEKPADGGVLIAPMDVIDNSVPENTAVGTWVISADTDLADARAANTTYTINYSAVFSGTGNKSIDITLPAELKFTSTKPVHSTTPTDNGIVDAQTTQSGNTLHVAIDPNFSGLTGFNIAVRLISESIYSKEQLAITNMLTSGVVSNTTQSTLTVFDYTLAQTQFTTKITNPNNTIYSEFPSKVAISYYNSYPGSCVNTGIIEKNCTITIDLSKYIYVKVGTAAYRPITSSEISITNSTNCTFDPTTMMLTLYADTIDYGTIVPTEAFDAIFHLAPGTGVKFGENAAGDASAVSYENGFINDDAKHTNFNFASNTFTVKSLQAETDISVIPPVSSTREQYLMPNKDNQQLFALGINSYAVDLDNLKFKVNIPSNATITGVFVENLSSVFTAPIKIYKDENDNNPQLLNYNISNINQLTSPITGTTSFIIEIPKFVASSSLPSNGVYTLNRNIRFFGSIAGTDGDTATFSVDVSNITADYSFDALPATNGQVVDIGNNNNSLVTHLSDKVYYDATFTENYLLNENKTLKSDTTVLPGTTYYWGAQITPSYTYSYLSAQRDFSDPVVYFSVPSEFIPVNADFIKDDLYATLSLNGGAAQVYSNDNLTFDIVPTSGANYNNGMTVIKVTAPGLNLHYYDNNFANYLGGKYDKLQIYLRVKLDDNIFTSKMLTLNPKGQLLTTIDQAAYDAGHINAGTGGTVLNNVYINDISLNNPTKRLLYDGGATKQLSISPVAVATMIASIKPSNSATFITFDPQNPTTAPSMSAGNFGDYKLVLFNGTSSVAANATGYFVLPADAGWNARITDGLIPTSSSITSGVTVYYSTATNLDGTTLPTNDTATWTVLSGSVDYSKITAIKVVVDSLSPGQFYEATVPFEIPAVNHTTVNYSIGQGNTSYKLGSTTVSQGKTAAIDLIQSEAPIVTPDDLGYTNNQLNLAYKGDATAINADILNATVTDDITGNTTLTRDGRLMGLDKTKSTISFNSGTPVTFENAGASPIDSRNIGTYTITYTSMPDHDGQVTTETRTILIGNPDEFSYTVEYYLDSMTGDPAFTETGFVCPEDTTLTSTIISADFVDRSLHSDWMNQHQPIGYSHGVLQGDYPVISSTLANVVKVLYTRINATLEISKRSDPAYTQDGSPVAVEPSQKITYYIDVKNTGVNDSMEVVVTDSVPTSTTLVANSAKANMDNVQVDVSATNDNLTFTATSIPAGETLTVEFAVYAPTGKVAVEFKNTAHVTALGDDFNKDTNEVGHKMVPFVPGELIISKSSNPATGSAVRSGYNGQPGTTITYFIKAQHHGQGAVPEVIVEDMIPAGTTYVENSATIELGGIKSADKGVLSDGKLTWKTNDLLGEVEVVCSFQVTVDPLPDDVYSKTYTNVATVNGKATNPVEHTATQFVKMPTKQRVNVGDTIDYSLEGIHNPENKAVTNFTIVDAPGKGLDFASAKVPAFYKGAGIKYDVKYKTSQDDKTWQVAFSQVDASKPYEFSLPSLPEGQRYTGIGLFFCDVPVDFALGNKLVYTFVVGADAPDNKLINNGWIFLDNVEIPVVPVAPPSVIPSVTPTPTTSPTVTPTIAPTVTPTVAPTSAPTDHPSATPTPGSHVKDVSRTGISKTGENKNYLYTVSGISFLGLAVGVIIYVGRRKKAQEEAE